MVPAPGRRVPAASSSMGGGGEPRSRGELGASPPPWVCRGGTVLRGKKARAGGVRPPPPRAAGPPACCGACRPGVPRLGGAAPASRSLTSSSTSVAPAKGAACARAERARPSGPRARGCSAGPGGRVIPGRFRGRAPPPRGRWPARRKLRSGPRPFPRVAPWWGRPAGPPGSALPPGRGSRRPRRVVGPPGRGAADPPPAGGGEKRCGVPAGVGWCAATWLILPVAYACLKD